MFVAVCHNGSGLVHPTATWLQLPSNTTVVTVDALSTFNFRTTASYTSVSDLQRPPPIPGSSNVSGPDSSYGNVTGVTTTCFRIVAFNPTVVIDPQNGIGTDPLSPQSADVH